MIPCIDLSAGKVVQWRRGREPVLERNDPEALARSFGRYGEVAVIDLDAALGRGNNRALVERLCQLAPCRVGGGIRTVEGGHRLLQAGAERLIIGTRATPDFLASFPSSRVLAALDEAGGEVVDHGWQRPTGHRAIERMSELRAFVSGFVYTLVDREGTLVGADIERFRQVSEATDLPIAVAGGISSVAEVVELDRLGIDCHVGMALYTGDIDLGEAVAACRARKTAPTQTPEAQQPLRVGIGKGRGCGQFCDFLQTAQLDVPAAFREGRKLVVTDERHAISLVLARNRDLPKLIRDGHLDVALASNAWFLEADDPELCCWSEQDFGACRLSLLRLAGSLDRPLRRVCTRFVNLARKNLPDTEIIHLAGCNEIAPFLGLADAVLDVVETGATLREMRLVEQERVATFCHSIWTRTDRQYAYHRLAKLVPKLASHELVHERG